MSVQQQEATVATATLNKQRHRKITERMVNLCKMHQFNLAYTVVFTVGIWMPIYIVQ